MKGTAKLVIILMFTGLIGLIAYVYSLNHKLDELNEKISQTNSSDLASGDNEKNEQKTPSDDESENLDDNNKTDNTSDGEEDVDDAQATATVADPQDMSDILPLCNDNEILKYSGTSWICAEDDFELLPVCDDDEILKYSNQEWGCAQDEDTNNVYYAGAGLVLQDNTFSIDLDETVPKSNLENSGTLSFDWSNEEVSDSLSIDSSGNVSWSALSSYPASCGAGMAVQAIGDTLTCVDLLTGESRWTLNEGDDILYPDLASTDVAIGGTDSTSPFYFDVSSSRLSVSSLRIGGETNYAYIDSNGFFQVFGDATSWEDLRIPMTSTTTGGSKDPNFLKVLDNGAGSQGVFAYRFDSGLEEELYFAVQLPHNWKEGSTLHPHVHWMPTNANAGNVVWSLEYTWANIEGTYGNTNIITVTDAADGIAFKHQMPVLANIDGTGHTGSSMILCRVFRQAGSASDTYGSDAALLEIDFHYEIDKLGEDELP